MDSEVQRDGRILDLIDDAWREDKLPYEDVAIPLVGALLLINLSKGYCVHHSPFQEKAQSVVCGVANLYKRLLDLTPSLPYMPVIPVCMKTWMFLSLIPWTVAEFSLNWSTLPIALSWVWHLGEVESSFLSASLSFSWCLRYFMHWFGEQRISLTLTVSALVMLYFHFLQCHLKKLRSFHRCFNAVFSRYSVGVVSSRRAVRGWQVQQDSCLQCCVQGMAPLIQGTAARPERGSRGKTADPTESRAEASDLPYWHLSLAILKLPEKWEVAKDFPFPFSLWYMSFTLASKDKTAMGIVGCWFLLAQRHFHIYDVAQALALPPLAFQRGWGAAAQLRIHMYSTHFPAKSWAWGKHLAEVWFSAKRAQTLLCLGQPLLGKLSIINKFLVDNCLHPESKHYCFFP